VTYFERTRKSSKMEIVDLELSSELIDASEAGKRACKKYNTDGYANVKKVFEKQHGGSYHGLLVLAGLEIIGGYTRYSRQSKRKYDVDTVEPRLGGQVGPDIMNLSYNAVVEAGDLNRPAGKNYDEFSKRVEYLIGRMLYSNDVTAPSIPMLRFFHVDRDFFDTFAFQEDSIAQVENPQVERITIDSFGLDFSRTDDFESKRYEDNILKVYRDKAEKPEPDPPDVELF
jgi:hypothetical protein